MSDEDPSIADVVDLVRRRYGDPALRYNDLIIQTNTTRQALIDLTDQIKRSFPATTPDEHRLLLASHGQVLVAFRTFVKLVSDIVAGDLS